MKEPPGARGGGKRSKAPMVTRGTTSRPVGTASVAGCRARVRGTVVAHYIKIAGGKLGVTFAVDVESAQEIATAYYQMYKRIFQSISHK